MKRWLKRLLCRHLKWTDQIPRAEYPWDWPVYRVPAKCLACGKLITRPIATISEASRHQI